MNYRTNKNAGFSMIEVLVASTILVVIVMMLAMLFQQTSMAWRTGVRRADAFMQIRSLIGSIQRDAAKAVDEHSIPKDLRAKLGTGSQNFKGSTLGFYTLSASGFYEDDINKPLRSISFVQYEKTGKRTETILLAKGGKEKIDSDVKEFIKSVGSQNKPTTELQSFEAEWGKNPQSGLPLSVRLKARVDSQGYNLEIGAASAGPDGAWGTKDDIRTWVE